MTPLAASLVIAFLQSLPTLINAGVNVFTLITNTTSSVKTMIAESRDPTPVEWNAMHAALHALDPPGVTSPFPTYEEATV